MQGAQGTPAGRAYVEVGTNNSPFEAGMRSVEDRLKRFGSFARQVGMSLLQLGAGPAAFFAYTIKKASDAEETMSAFRTVFTDMSASATQAGDSAAKAADRSSKATKGAQQSAKGAAGAFDQAGKAAGKFGKAVGTGPVQKFKQETAKGFSETARAAEEWGDALANATGRSKVGTKDAMTSFQAFFKGLGFGNEEARNMTQRMTELGIDLASFRNIDDADALHRFLSAMAGSVQVLDQFGIDLHEASIEQEFLRMGLNKTTANASEQEKVLARMNLITRAMGMQGATGDAVRTAGSFANQWRRLKSQLQDGAVAIGTAVLPAVTALVNRVGNFVKGSIAWIQANGGLVRSLAAVTAALIAGGVALVAIGVASSALGTIVGLLAGAFNVLSTAAGMVTSPIKMLRGAFALLASAIGMVWGLLGSLITLQTVAMAGLLALGVYVGYVGYQIIFHSNAGQRALDFLGKSFAWLSNQAKAALGAIQKAFMSGNIELAAKILWVGLKIAWTIGTEWIVDNWKLMFLKLEELLDDFGGTFRQKWQSISHSIAATMAPYAAKLFGLDPEEMQKQLEGINKEETDKIDDKNGERKADRARRRAKIAETDPELAKLIEELGKLVLQAGVGPDGKPKGTGAGVLPMAQMAGMQGLAETKQRSSQFEIKGPAAASYGSSEAANAVSRSMGRRAQFEASLLKNSNDQGKEQKKQTLLLKKMAEKQGLTINEVK